MIVSNNKMRDIDRYIREEQEVQALRNYFKKSGYELRLSDEAPEKGLDVSGSWLWKFVVENISKPECQVTLNLRIMPDSSNKQVHYLYAAPNIMLGRMLMFFPYRSGEGSAKGWNDFQKEVVEPIVKTFRDYAVQKRQTTAIC
jgi:hypothetical protein